MYFDESRIPLFVLILLLANLVIVLVAYICCGISGDIAYELFFLFAFYDAGIAGAAWLVNCN